MYVKKQNIFVGDIIKSQFEVITLVCKDCNGDLYGSLICDINHSCRNIPYAINNGEEYKLIYRDK